MNGVYISRTCFPVMLSSSFPDALSPHVCGYMRHTCILSRPQDLDLKSHPKDSRPGANLTMRASFNIFCVCHKPVSPYKIHTSHVARKLVFTVSDQVGHKLKVCTVTSRIKSNNFIGKKSNDRIVTIYNTVHITYM